MHRPMRPLSPLAKAALLAEALVLVLLARVALWVLPFRWVQRGFQWAARPRRRLAATRGSTTDAPLRARAVARAVGTAGLCVPKGNCLPQALAAMVLLGRAGHAPQLHIGVRKDAAGRLKAHAWVDCRGQVVVGGAESPGVFRPVYVVTQVQK